MAKLNDIRVRLDPFFTDTRIVACEDMGCRFNLINTDPRGRFGCGLKWVCITQEGICSAREAKDEDEQKRP